MARLGVGHCHEMVKERKRREKETRLLWMAESNLTSLKDDLIAAVRRVRGECRAWEETELTPCCSRRAGRVVNLGDERLRRGYESAACSETVQEDVSRRSARGCEGQEREWKEEEARDGKRSR
eukprot:766763-Hanusia_phi.AAC.1